MMPPESLPRISEVLLRRYLDGTCTPEEAQTIAGWARAQPLGAALVRGLREEAAADWDDDVAVVWSRIQGAVRRDTTAGRHFDVVHPMGVDSTRTAWLRAGRTARRGVSSWGAELLLTTAVVALVLVRPGATPGNPAGAYARDYSTPTGHRAIVSLPGGVRVTLAPHSTLRVPREFGAHDRTVALVGEGYFEVPHEAGAPFVVQAGGVRARVLGTAFAVRRYATDGAARVVVTEGKVSVSGARARNASVVLTAGLGAEVTDSGTATTPAASGDEAAWASGRLVFHDVPLREVLETLSRWYGYEFRLGDPALARRNLTMIASTDSVAITLSTLKLLLNVDLRFDGNIVTLAPHAARRGPALRRDEVDASFNHTREAGR